jgi:hypothetical protein
MKIKYVKSDAKFRSLSAREVDELINSTILKPVPGAKKETEKRVFNKWDLPVESRPYLRCKKHDPL